MSARRTGSIQPYSKEPVGPPEDVNAPPAVMRSTELTVTATDQAGRTTNTDWCTCNNCVALDAEECCLCCRESPTAVDRSGDASCVLQHPSFEAVCLNQDVLTVTLISRREFCNPQTDVYSNR